VAGVTAAVKVTACAGSAGFRLEATVMDVEPSIVMVAVVETLRKFVSPL
jgi:hypothetical protein